MRYVVRGAGLVLLTVLAAPALSASGRGSWLEPTELPQPLADPVSLAMAEAGTAIAVWGSYRGIEAAVKEPDERSWRYHKIAAGDASAWPLVAVDARGNATVVWTQPGNDSITRAIKVAVRPAGRRFGPPAIVAAVRGLASLRLAVGPRGDAIVAWSRAEPAGLLQIEAARRREGGRFESPQRLGTTSLPGATPRFPYLDAAVDKRGNAIVTWGSGWDWRVGACDLPLSPRPAFAAFAPAGRPFRSAQPISGNAAGWAIHPRVAFDESGNAIAVWRRLAQCEEPRIESAVRPVTRGAWLAPQYIAPGNPGGEATWDPQVAVDGSGAAQAIWGTGVTGRNEVMVAERPARGGRWREPTLLVRDSDFFAHLTIVGNPSGSVIVSWSHDESVRALIRTPRVGWSAPVSLWTVPGPMAPHNQPTVMPAIDGQGNALVAWALQGPPGERRLWTSGYDTSGPQLRALRVPAVASVAQPVRFSVAPVDVWSPVTATRWSFGDGGRVKGIRVTHTFRRPGTYVVRVTSTDSVGYISTASRRVVIR